MAHGLQGREPEELAHAIGAAEGCSGKRHESDREQHRARHLAADRQALEQRLVVRRQERADAEGE
jgi:hypothetical protein